MTAYVKVRHIFMREVPFTAFKCILH